MSSFRIGDKVVCVVDAFARHTSAQAKYFPKQDKVYTVRGVREFGDGVPGILLDEVQNNQSSVRLFDPVEPETIEPCWYAWRFRPVSERELEIADHSNRSVFEKQTECV